MIPLRLTFSGIYSYQTLQEIDFSRLAEAQLFGIFGPVGSGKSSILEAISFTLYGQTERLNQRDGLAYNMMNLKSNQIMIRFDFRAGQGAGDEYRFEVSAKRHRSKFDQVRAFERRQFRKINGEWQPETLTADEILGLSYDNFRRTIIIHQGKFQEFLQLGKKDRTQMLQEIFHLQRFDLSDKVSRLATANERAISTVEGALSGIGDVSTELIRNREAELTEQQKTVVQLEKNLREQEKALRDLEDVQQAFQELSQQKKRMEELNAREPAIRKMEDSLREYVNCRNRFGAILERKKEHEKSLRQQQKILEQDREKFRGLEQRRSDLAEQFAELEQRYQQRDTLLAQANELEKISEILKLRTKASRLDARKKELADVIQKKQRELAAKEKQAKSIQEEMESLQRHWEDWDILNHVQQWHTQAAQLDKQMSRARHTLRRRESDFDVSQKNFELIYRELAKDFADLPSLEKFSLSVVDSMQSALQKEKSAIMEELQHLHTQAHLAEQAGSLQPGKPCPLCGSLTHPAPLQDARIQAKVKQHKAALHSIEEKIARLTEAGNKLREINTKQNMIREQLAEARQILNDAEAAIEVHQEKFGWEKFRGDTAESIQRKFEQAQTGQQKLKQAQANQQQLLEEMEQLRDGLGSLRSDLYSLEKEELKYLQRIALMRESLKYFSAKDEEGFSPKDALMKAGDIRKKLRRVEQEHQEKKRELEHLQSDLDTLNGVIRTRKETLDGLASELETLLSNLHTQIKESPYPDAAAVEKVLALALDEEKTRKEITDFEKQTHDIRRQIERLEKKISGREFDPDRLEILIRQTEKSRQQLKIANQQIGTIQTQIKELKQKLQERHKLEKELQELSRRRENLKVLKSLFQGKRFVEYASRLYLQNLCESANQRFRQLTRRRLQLEIGPETEILVRDLLNNGQTRSVKTLSGGQTFQASLCLALALADNVQVQAGAEHSFFFLDEGFGTLDKESLLDVFNALKSLRKERRVVGVISHVEELQQEMDVYLNIRHDEEEGSQVIPSWQDARSS